MSVPEMKDLPPAPRSITQRMAESAWQRSRAVSNASYMGMLMALWRSGRSMRISAAPPA